MGTNRPFRVTPQIVFGLVIIAIGVIFTLDNLHLIYAHDYLRYWPAFLILFGLAKFMQLQSSAGRIWGVMWIIFGTALLLDNLHIFTDFEIWDLWPLFLVMLGGSMIMRSRSYHRVGRDLKETDSTINGIAIMGVFKRTNSSQDFRGGQLTAIMGGCEVDLRQASIQDPNGAVIDVFTFWGGVELKVPEDWAVDVQGIPLMGGFDDKTHPPTGGSNKKLIVKGYAVMGGMEIKN